MRRCALYAPDHVHHKHSHDPLPFPELRTSRCSTATNRRMPTLARIGRHAGDGRGADRLRGLVVTIITTRWTHARRSTAVEERGISVDRFANGVVAETWLMATDWGYCSS